MIENGNSLKSFKFWFRLTSSDQRSPSVPVHYERMSCNGTEQFLSDCQSAVLTATPTSSFDDVFIVCLPRDQTYSGKQEYVGVAMELIINGATKVNLYTVHVLIAT